MSRYKNQVNISVNLLLTLLLGIVYSSSANAQCDEEYAASKTAQASYPRRAQERGIEGYAVVQFTITTEGEIKDIQVIESEPKGVFDRSAIKATNEYQYEPCIENGQAFEIKDKKLKFSFQLQ